MAPSFHPPLMSSLSRQLWNMSSCNDKKQTSTEWILEKESGSALSSSSVALLRRRWIKNYLMITDVCLVGLITSAQSKQHETFRSTPWRNVQHVSCYVFWELIPRDIFFHDFIIFKETISMYPLLHWIRIIPGMFWYVYSMIAVLRGMAFTTIRLANFHGWLMAGEGACFDLNYFPFFRTISLKNQLQ